MMGLFGAVVERVGLRNLILMTPLLPPLLVVGVVGLILATSLVENIRLRRMPGKRAPRVPNTGFLGIRFARESLRTGANSTHFEFWTKMFNTLNIGAPVKIATTETRIAGRRIVMTMEPENIKAILATQFDDFGKGKPFLDEWRDFLGESIFTTDGAAWHDSRHLIRPQFVKDRISDLECFENHVRTLFKAIANGVTSESDAQPVELVAGVANGKVIDISDLFFRYTLDVTTEFLLGMDLKTLSTPDHPFAAAFNEVQRWQTRFARAGPLNRFMSRKRFNAALGIVNKHINMYIDRVLAMKPEQDAQAHKGSSGYTFVHALSEFTRDPQALRDQIIAVLLAGRDTTAATLSFTVYELARHPAAVQRLRAEILSVVGPSDAPTYAHLKAMKYLNNVLQETLRLYPVVPFNVRLALKDTTLPRGGGPLGTDPIPVLKDTTITYSTLCMQRRADLYPTHPDYDANRPKKRPADDPALTDPDEWCPERWETWQPKPWHHVPFNGGPRICVGQQFALTEMGYVITRLFQRFERIHSSMGAIDGGKPKLATDITLSPGDGVWVAFWEPATQETQVREGKEGRDKDLLT